MKDNPPRCYDCKFLRDGRCFDIHSPEFDVIRGHVYRTPRAMREDADLCGWDAKYFQPLPEPTTSWGCVGTFAAIVIAIAAGIARAMGWI